MRAFPPALFGFILLLQSAQAAVDGLNPDGSLDRSRISKAYFEGDFDMVVSALETFRKLHPDPSREDKIYTYKYLSVIYAAKPETRGKAESFMYQLLKIMPSIELMDLYISDNIEAIFNSVRIRFEQQQRIGPDSTGSAASGKGKPPAASLRASDKSSTWVWWTAGAAVGVAAAVAGFVYLSDSPKTASMAPDTLDLK
ncbi:MAG TPA: hypothetical protein VJ385_09630 [Fibrobacteria bacterium]|nr:hypothetical protein [Fibrobacteria bacterium]